MAGTIIFGSGFSPAAAEETNNGSGISADTESRLTLLANLKLQIEALKTQIFGLNQDLEDKQIESQANAMVISKQLGKGSSGDDVRILQAILAADASIYPEGLITGFYGPATARAVAKFQAKNNLAAVGVVGPMTLARLNAWLAMNQFMFESDVDARFCVIVPPGHFIAPGWLRHNGGRPVLPACQILPPGIDDMDDEEKPEISEISTTEITATSATIEWETDERSTSKVYYSTSSPVNKNTAQTVRSQNLVKDHSETLIGLTADTTYYFLVESRDRAGNVAISSEVSFKTLVATAADTTAPVISAVASANITASGATITWTTNENATSKVYYSTTSPINFASAASVSDSALRQNHSLNLTGLTANTRYYFAVESKDAANNMARGTEAQFTTLQAADTAAPVISAVATSNITASGATITWTTNENASTKVYFASTSPINIAAAQSVTGDASVTAHSVQLVNLSANTRYYFIVESKDGSNNVAVSAEGSFQTAVAADTVNPTVSITSPAANANVSGNQTVAAEANDNVGVVKVELYIDGALKLSDLVSPYSFSWDTTNGGNHPCNGDHTHTLQARAYDAAGNVGMSSNVVVSMHEPDYCDDDTTAPVISGGAAVGITANAATIVWSTNENATSKVYYSTSTPVNTASAQFAADATLLMNHSVVLAGLTANTRYYFVVESKDAGGNVSLGAEGQFMTLVGTQADTTAPVISNITINSIREDRATVKWTTNENASSKVYYSRTNGFAIANAENYVSVNGSVMDHSVMIANLQKDTRYYVVIESVDAAGNVALSAQQTFRTRD